MAQAKYSYVGPRTTVTVPAQKEGDEAEALSLVPGGVYALTKHQLDQPIVARYIRSNALMTYEEPTKAATSATRKKAAEATN